MRYVKWSDVVGRYPRAATITQAEEVTIEANFIAGAEGEVDAALAGRYTTPLASTPTLAPALVRDITIDLAYYKAAFLQLDDTQSKRLADYIKERLFGLATGSLTLVSSGGVLVTPAGKGTFCTVADFPNISGTDPVADWQVSSVEALASRTGRGYPDVVY